MLLAYHFLRLLGTNNRFQNQIKHPSVRHNPPSGTRLRSAEMLNPGAKVTLREHRDRTNQVGSVSDASTAASRSLFRGGSIGLGPKKK